MRLKVLVPEGASLAGLVQTAPVLVLRDDVDAPGLRVDHQRLGVPCPVGVLHVVLRGADGLVLELLRLGQLVDPDVVPGAAEVVADVADVEMAVRAHGDGLHVPGPPTPDMVTVATVSPVLLSTA